MFSVQFFQHLSDITAFFTLALRTRRISDNCFLLSAEPDETPVQTAHLLVSAQSTQLLNHTTL